MHADSAIVVMAKEPVPGKVKTRLVPPLTAGQACSLHEALVRDTLETAGRAASAAGAGFLVAMAREAAPTAARRRIAGHAEALGARTAAQTSGLLGARMRAAIELASAAGARRIIVVGTDCPGLEADDVTRALDLLAERRVVLGPADDGGYYLVGVTLPVPGVFGDAVPWGTDAVLEATLSRLSAAGIAPALLDTKYDVDDAEDLARLGRAIAAGEFPGAALRFCRPEVSKLEASGLFSS